MKFVDPAKRIAFGSRRGGEMTRRRTLLPLLVLLAACGDPPRPDRVPVGTWGGDDAGMIVEAASAHVHIGCTKGDVPQTIPVDARRRFDVAGTYNLDAYPVDRGILHPARLTGWTDGRTLILTVVLTDTGRILGPVGLTFGAEPRMQNCPICRRPEASR